VLWTHARADADRSLADAVERFEAVDHPAGSRAARFLKREALANDPSTRTRMLVIDGEIEAFISLSNAVVRLDEEAMTDDLDVVPRRELPATLLAWVAKRRGSQVSGFHVLTTAYGLAREAATTVGSVAFVLDAADESTRALWMRPPYGFRASRRRNRLWLPLSPES
jgi:hypothetical protein